MKFQIIFCFALFFVAVYCDDKPTEMDPDACTAGEEFKIDCNSCICGTTGKKSESSCTLMVCPDASSNPLPQFAGEKCDPGTTFMVDCNSCSCPTNGDKSQAACTVMAC